MRFRVSFAHVPRACGARAREGFRFGKLESRLETMFWFFSKLRRRNHLTYDNNASLEGCENGTTMGTGLGFDNKFQASANPPSQTFSELESRSDVRCNPQRSSCYLHRSACLRLFLSFTNCRVAYHTWKDVEVGESPAEVIRYSA
jgi:hypothetical protein